MTHNAEREIRWSFQVDLLRCVEPPEPLAHASADSAALRTGQARFRTTGRRLSEALSASAQV